jgi:hypothetical protein
MVSCVDYLQHFGFPSIPYSSTHDAGYVVIKGQIKIRLLLFDIFFP